MPKVSSQLPNMHLNKVIDTLEDLVQTTLECEKNGFAPGVSFVEVTKQLSQLKLLMDQLNSAHNNVLKALSINEREIEGITKNKESFKEPDRKVLSRLENLQKQCTEGRDRMYALLQENRQTVKDVEKQLEKGKKSAKGGLKPVSRKSKWLKT